MRGFVGFVGALMALIYSTCCMAQSKLAILIGNDRYESIVKLESAVSDAKTIGTILQTLEFDTVVETNLTQARLNRSLSNFEKKIDRGDVVVFFYAGHGVEIDNRNYLLPVDIPAVGSDEADLVRRSSLPVDDLIQSFRNRGAKTVIAIVDACRDNPFPGVAVRGARPVGGLAKMEQTDGVFILFSAGTKQRALDRLGPGDKDPNSVFTRALRKYLASPGLDVTDIAKQVRTEVKALAATINFTQYPTYVDGLDGAIILVPKGGRITVETDSGRTTVEPGDGTVTETAFWNGVVVANKAASYRLYLDKVKNGTFSGIFSDLAQQRVAELDSAASETPKNKPEKSRAVETEAKKVAALGGPRKVFTAGNNGNVYVEGSFTNMGEGIWVEENSEGPGNPLEFRAVNVGKDRIVLYDEDRDLYLELNLKNKTTRWKRGNVKNWNALYKIIKVIK